MDQLKELLIRYCKATNINPKAEENIIDIKHIFVEANNRGLLSAESLNNILSIANN